MPTASALGEFEQVVLLAVLRCGAEAYGVSTHAEIERRTGRKVALGAIYMTLDRLERKGLVQSTMGKPTPERGGRAKRYYELTKPALAALRETRQALLNLWDGLESFG